MGTVLLASPWGEERAGSDVNVSPIGSSGDLAAGRLCHSIALLSCLDLQSRLDGM